MIVTMIIEATCEEGDCSLTPDDVLSKFYTGALELLDKANLEPSGELSALVHVTPGCPQTDQYGERIPELCEMPSFDEIVSADQYHAILNARWYELDGSRLAIAYDDVLPYGIDYFEDVGPYQSIMLVDRPLHRGNATDGWYHA